MRPATINNTMYCGVRIEFEDLDGRPGHRLRGQKLPRLSRPTGLRLLRGDDETAARREINDDDVVVYATGDTIDFSEVLSSRDRRLNTGVTVLAIYFRGTNEVFDLMNVLDRSMSVLPTRLNLANRIEMALGARGVFI